MPRTVSGIRMVSGFVIGCGVMLASSGYAGEISVLTRIPDPPIASMEIAPVGEVVKVTFADGTVIESPEVDISSLRGVDLLEIYNIPIDLWSVQTTADGKIFRLPRTPLSRGLNFVIPDDENFILNMNEQGQTYEVTDVNGEKLSDDERFLAELDNGSADVLGYRTFTMVEYRIGEQGEVLRRILKPSASDGSK